MWANGKITIRKAAESLGMNHSTFYRRCMEYMKKDEEKRFKL
ncbi:MAG: hypothetical protein K2K46_00005 [Lachnospiraceae bacterium]|nr:hypothetical protein [Lachnospiraceae bacterium]